jgi:Zn-dependent peptidase ImmA (M78 family)
VLRKRQGPKPNLLIADLAKTFQVSPEAMSYRLTNLGILDPYSLAG